MSNLWYVWREGQAIGPFATSEIKSQAINGTLTPGMEVRRADGTQWVAAEKLKGLVFTKMPQASVTPETDSDGDSKISISDLPEVEFPSPFLPPPPLPYIAQTASVPATVHNAGLPSPTNEADRRGFIATCLGGIGAVVVGVLVFMKKAGKNRTVNAVLGAAPFLGKVTKAVNEYQDASAPDNSKPELVLSWADATELLITELQKLPKEEQEAFVLAAETTGNDLYCIYVEFRNVGKLPLVVRPEKLFFRFDQRVFPLQSMDPPNNLAGGSLAALDTRHGFMLIEAPVKDGVSIRKQTALLYYDDPSVLIK